MKDAERENPTRGTGAGGENVRYLSVSKNALGEKPFGCDRLSPSRCCLVSSAVSASRECVMANSKGRTLHFIHICSNAAA
jgi:hypothetical protein